MNLKNIFITIVLFLSVGAGSYLIYNDYVIIFSPQIHSHSSIINAAPSAAIHVNLFTYNEQIDGHYTSESTILKTTKHDIPTTSLYHLVDAWLLAQEQGQKRMIEIENVALSSDNTLLFINFTAHPFSKNNSTFEKLAWIQGLFHTISNYNNQIKSVYLMVKQKPILDYELTFEQSWPIEGFL